MKNIILFDIDNTLIDTNLLRKNFAKKVKDLHIEENIINKVNRKYINKLVKTSEYNPVKHLYYLKNDINASTWNQLINFFFSDDEFYKNTLYPDVVPTISSLSRKYILGIFSEGNISFQINKLMKTHIKKFFNSNYFFILKDKLERRKLLFLPAETVIVDDKLFVLEEITKTKKNLLPVWINRKNLKNSNQSIISINKLNLLEKYLNY